MICGNCGCFDIWHGVGLYPGTIPEGTPCANSITVDQCWHFCHCKGYKPQMPQYPARPDWNQYFQRIAKEVSSRSTCNRLHVGCVVTEAGPDRSILLTSYNGAPAHTEHCPPDEDRSPDAHCETALHAENNAMVQAARRGISLVGAVWNLWPVGPCANCQRRYIIPTHASQVVFPKHDRAVYVNSYDTSLLVQAGIEVTVLE